MTKGSRFFEKFFPSSNYDFKITDIELKIKKIKFIAVVDFVSAAK
jgi:hypothetical protein